MQSVKDNDIDSDIDVKTIHLDELHLEDFDEDVLLAIYSNLIYEDKINFIESKEFFSSALQSLKSHSYIPTDLQVQSRMHWRWKGVNSM